jgi:large repetitive protein
LPAFNVSLSAVGDLAFSDDVLNIAPLSQFGEITSVNFEAILNSASFFEAVNINARVEQIGAAPDDFVEPAEQSLQIFTHFDFMPSRYDDDMSVGLTSQHDWQAIQNNESLIGFTIEDGAWHGPDNGVNGAIDLVSPKIRVAATGEFSVDFEHFFFFESSDNQDDIFTHWDGGVIEISIDGEGWQDVVTAGATLSEPYNGQIDTSNSVIGSRAAYVFTRDPQNAIVQLQANRISFAEGLVNGHNIRLRFRIGSDARTGDFGWLIDNVVVNNAIDPPFSDIVAEDNICLSASRPLVDAGEDIVIVPGDNNDILIELSGQATDADGDSLTYQWSQRAGSTVNLTNSNTANAQFSLAAPQQDQKLIFELIVSDGDYQASDIKTVTIRLNRAPTVSLADVVAVEGERVTLIATANDEEGDPLDFVWRQLAGPTVNFTDNGTAMIEFTAPQVDSLTELMFEVQALDGRLTSLPATAKVTINNSVSRKSGGGGMTGWALLLLIGLSQIGNLCGHRRTNQRNSPS